MKIRELFAESKSSNKKLNENTDIMSDVITAKEYIQKFDTDGYHKFLQLLRSQKGLDYSKKVHKLSQEHTNKGKNDVTRSIDKNLISTTGSTVDSLLRNNIDKFIAKMLRSRYDEAVDYDIDKDYGLGGAKVGVYEFTRTRMNLRDDIRKHYPKLYNRLLDAMGVTEVSDTSNKDLPEEDIIFKKIPGREQDYQEILRLSAIYTQHISPAKVSMVGLSDDD